ncbi:ubiquinol-cytochrome c reductase iron-sulfur subunit [soil metagenome]
MTCVAGGGFSLATAMPLGASFAPSERAKAAGGPVEVDISGLAVGELKVVEWQGKPVWLLKRDKTMLDSLAKTQDLVADPDSKSTNFSTTPDYAKNQFRAREDHKELLVAVGICTHLGCSPSARFTPGPQANLPNDWEGGFLCPCHGSTFDLAGRVFKNKPAPDNLQIPKYAYLSDTRLLIGDDKKA